MWMITNMLKAQNEHWFNLHMLPTSSIPYIMNLDGIIEYLEHSEGGIIKERKNNRM